MSESLPIVVVIGRTASASSFESAMTGGSPVVVVFWAFKVLTIWYSALFLIANGISSWLTFHMSDRAGGNTVATNDGSASG